MLFVELQRVIANGSRGEAVLDGLKCSDRFRQRFHGLLFEKNPGAAFRQNGLFGIETIHSLQGPAASVGNHGPARRLRFYGCQAYVLFSRKQERSAPAIVLSNNLVGLKAKKGNGRSGDL